MMAHGWLPILVFLSVLATLVVGQTTAEAGARLLQLQNDLPRCAVSADRLLILCLRLIEAACMQRK